MEGQEFFVFCKKRVRKSANSLQNHIKCTMSVHFETTYILDINGNLWVTGDNTYGQCGLDSEETVIKTWTKVPDMYLDKYFRT